MKIQIHKCPRCGGEYGAITDDWGTVLTTRRCRCQIKRMVAEIVITALIILAFCYLILGGYHAQNNDPKLSPGPAYGTLTETSSSPS